MPHPIITTKDGVRLTVQVHPRASRTEVAGVHGDALKVRLMAPPVDGAANAALVEFLAGVLGVKRGAVELVAGETGRRKVLVVTGISAAEAERRLQLEPGRPTG